MATDSVLALRTASLVTSPASAMVMKLSVIKSIDRPTLASTIPAPAWRIAGQTALILVKESRRAATASRSRWTPRPAGGDGGRLYRSGGFLHRPDK